MEPFEKRRVAIGVLVATLVLGAGLLGWMRAAGPGPAQRVDQPAKGGLLSDAAGADKLQAGMARTGLVGAPGSSGWRTPTQGGAAGRSTVGAQDSAAATGRSTTGAQGGTASTVRSTAGSQAGAAPAVRPPAASRSSDSRAQVVHEVAEGDTLFRIAKRYGVKAEALQVANGLASDLIRPGQLLVVPGAVGGTAVSLEGTYIWPVLAPISSNFGPRWGRNHNGLDLASNHGDDVKASRGGEVWVAGEVTGYGQTVIIQHGDNSRSVYAHLSKILVEHGDKVEQGQLIALVGSTGNSTGPHLHFEIIVNDQPRDPLLYLPPR